MTVVLDSTTHQYFDGGRRVLGVTEALTIVGVLNTEWYEDRGTERGSRVHDQVRIANTDRAHGRDPTATLWPDKPELDAYLAFLADYDPVIFYVEHLVAHPVLAYAGTADLVCLLRKSVPEPHLAVIDAKTGGPELWHGLQVSLYFEAARAMGLLTHRAVPVLSLPKAYGLYLTPGARRPYDLRGYPFNPVALSMMASAQWKFVHQFKSRGEW